MSKRKIPPTMPSQTAENKGKLLQMPDPPDIITLTTSRDPIGHLRRITLAASQNLPPGMERTLEYPQE